MAKAFTAGICSLNGKIGKRKAITESLEIARLDIVRPNKDLAIGARGKGFEGKELNISLVELLKRRNLSHTLAIVIVPIKYKSNRALAIGRSCTRPCEQSVEEMENKDTLPSATLTKDCRRTFEETFQIHRHL